MRKTIIYLAFIFLPISSTAYADYEFEIKSDAINFTDKAKNMGILAQGKGDKPCKIDIVLADFTNLMQQMKSKPLSISLSIMGGLKSGEYPITKSNNTAMGSKWFKENTEKVLITWQNGKGTKAKLYGGLDGVLTIKREGKKVSGNVVGKLAEYKSDPSGKLEVVSTVDVNANFNHELATDKKSRGIGNSYFCKDK